MKSLQNKSIFSAQAATDATNAGFEKGKSLIQEELVLSRIEKEIFKKQNQDLKADSSKAHI